MKTQNQVLSDAVKNLLVAANAGDDISEPLLHLEHAMEHAEPGWCVADEIRKRLEGQSCHERNVCEQ